MSLEDDLAALAVLGRRVKRSMDEKGWEDLISTLTEYELLRKNIRTSLLNQPVASIEDPDAVALLMKITTGKNLVALSIGDL